LGDGETLPSDRQIAAADLQQDQLRDIEVELGP
jgi:hypothetical protein